MANSNFNCTLVVTVSGSSISAYMQYKHKTGTFTYSDTKLPTPTMTIAGTNYSDTAFANKVHSGVSVGTLNSTTYTKSNLANGTYQVKWTCGSGLRSDFSGTWTKSVTVNTGTGPSGFVYSLDSVTPNSISVKTEVGDFGSGTFRYLEYKAFTADSTTYWGTSKGRWKQITTKAATNVYTLTNSDNAEDDGPLDIRGCVSFKLGAGVFMSNGEQYSIDNNTIYYTPPTALTELTNTGYVKGTTSGTVDYTITMTGGTSGNAPALNHANQVTNYYRYSSDGGVTYTDWISAGTGLTSEQKTFHVIVPGNKSCAVQAKQTYGTADSDIKTISFASPKLATLYGSVNGKTKAVKKLYCSVDGKARRVTKLYGSVNGKTKLIYSE